MEEMTLSSSTITLLLDEAKLEEEEWIEINTSIFFSSKLSNLRFWPLPNIGQDIIFQD
jgi:hypothetical protein